MAAVFWEVRPVTVSTLDAAFEYVLIDAPSLVSTVPDPRAFGARFDARATVVDFENLGRDATLVVPCPVDADTGYGHLVAFVRSARPAQVDALWRRVFGLVTQHLSDAPLWVNTSGLGVAWLHVRLDTFPKYYNHAAYRAQDWSPQTA